MTRINENRIFACYNISVSLQFHGPLQVEAMQKAVQVLIERHEMLRTTIISLEDQCILPSLKLPDHHSLTIS
ncbi:MAG: hypothetical protein DRR19_31705 [Candidatus Parabeggiatoa sp. nov. 1]|nr:MAG: hypothetical protein DRR19_31705 [Gammaproteobacteria bacterium]